MASLKPGKVATITLGAVMVMVVFRGAGTEPEALPWGAFIFIAITLGIIAAVVVAVLPGDGRKQADQSAGPRVIPGWEAPRQPIAPTAGFALRETSSAPVILEPARTAIVFLE